MCGKIQCQSSAKKPQGTNTVSIDTTIRFNGREVKCRGTYMYTAKDDEEDLSDPGLVMTGTKCGDGMVSTSSWGWSLLQETISLALIPVPMWMLALLCATMGHGFSHTCRHCPGDISAGAFIDITRCMCIGHQILLHGGLHASCLIYYIVGQP